MPRTPVTAVRGYGSLLDWDTRRRYNKGIVNDTDMSIFPTITLQDIKRHGAKALPKKQVVYLIVNSKPHAAIVPFDDYEAMMRIIEDFEDMQDIEERKNEPLIPFDEAFPPKKKK